jgi:hypothetical protein
VKALAALCIALLGVSVGLAAAADLKVTATFDALEIRPDDLVAYTITITGQDLPRLRQDPSPDFTGFQVSSGPSRGSSTSINMVGGQTRMEQSLTLTWQLMPRGGREGTLTVPAFAMALGSEALRVPPATVKSDLQAAPRRRTGRRRSGAFDPFSSQRRGRSSGAGTQDQHLEIRERISGREVYLGEEVVLTHVLEFGPGSVVRTFDPEAVEFSGFEKQERKVEHQARKVSGKDWQEVPLAQWRLVPFTTGKRAIPARGYVLHLQPNSRDLFEGFFSAGERQVRRATRSIEIDVKPLPRGAPRDFGGAVGTFQVESSLGARSLNQGDGTTLSVVVRGTGNFAAVKAPELRLPTGVRAFDPEVRDDTRKGRDGRTTGAKIFDYPLLIESAGEHRFEPLTWSYFDPKSGRYVTRQTRPLSLSAAVSAAPVSTGLGQAPRTSVVETLDSDIEHVATAWTPLPLRESSPGGLPAWFWPFLLAGPFLPVAGAVWSLTRSRNSDARTSRSKQAGKEARRRLSVASAAAKAGESAEAADAAAAAVSRFVVDRCGVGGAEPVASEVVALVKEQAGEALAARVSAHLADCDFLRFAGADPGGGEARARAEEATRLLQELERALSQGQGGRS